jgi:CRISPR-associated protein Csb2
MSLVLEVEYLSGISFAAIGPGSPVPDWPPQPDRIFSALVATWSARGQQRQEAQALEWLEEQGPPRIIASSGQARTTATVFVPPNDPRTDKLKNARGVFPPLRSRQPRQFGFPAVRPIDPIARIAWDGAVPEETTLSALQRLAHNTAYLGHSASLTRCQFFLDVDEPRPTTDVATQRRIYPGRFAELRREFEAGRRPLRGSTLAVRPAQFAPNATVFGERWLLLEHVDGDMPDLRACAIVAKTIRDALLSGYRRIGLEQDIPETVSGHTADGKASRVPHLAIVPLPFAGFAYADGHVMGYALIPPRAGELRDDADFLKALRAVAPIDAERKRRILTIKPREGTTRARGFSVDFSLTLEPPASKRSLDPSVYLHRARTFATITPIALDRHLRKEGQARENEIEAQIAAACRNIGLPEPVEVIAHKHSALEGVPSAYPSGKSPEWTRWRLPAALASRQLTHAVIRFAAPVEGPVILGAGRYVGLGFCRPIAEEA